LIPALRIRGSECSFGLQEAASLEVLLYVVAADHYYYSSASPPSQRTVELGAAEYEYDVD
jgi:hypothetical protein